MSEEQGEGNVTVYSDVCLRYRLREILLCTVMVPEVQSERNIIVYNDVRLSYRVRENNIEDSDVCLRYKMRKMLLCTVMCV